MGSIRKYVVIGVTIIGICLSCNSMASADEEGKALEAAKTWVTLIDEGRYDASWETAAVYFKNAITKDKWGQMLTAGRKPLGKLVSREIQSKTYKKSLPGAPDGEYVIIQFSTSFENEISGIETITIMLDSDGKWRTSGYYFK
ncbi:MAG: DUF4019 domain-containing protein [Desulfobacteraceae bacterium]|nr:DUF4019 domain-containing protein [Desulfobacteraceae bacterium]